MSPPELSHSTIAIPDYSNTMETQENDLKTNFIDGLSFSLCLIFVPVFTLERKISVKNFESVGGPISVECTSPFLGILAEVLGAS